MEGKSRILVVLAICVLMLWSLPVYATVYYVDSAKQDDTGDGTSWATAKRTISAAITAASGSGDIWVMNGTYQEPITLSNGVNLYGGFNGTETSIDQRDEFPRAEPDDEYSNSVLDGEVSRIVVNAPVNCTCVFDGFTVINGYCQSGNYPGGMYCRSGSSVRIVNNAFINNVGIYGGGLYLESVASTTFVDNNMFSENSTTSGGAGAGMYVRLAPATITNNNFVGNTGTALALYAAGATNIKWNVFDGNSRGIYAVWSTTGLIAYNTIKNNYTTSWGAGILCQWAGCNPTIANNLIIYNTSEGRGGGIFCDEDAPKIINNTFAYNSSPSWAGAVQCWDAPDAVIANNIISYNDSWGVIYEGCTPPLTQNCVYGNSQGNYYPTNIPHSSDINIDQLFADAGNGDYRLTFNSPCIDAGDDNAVEEDWTDLGGYARQIDILSISGSLVDIGAYEYVDDSAPSTPTVTAVGAQNGAYTTSDGELQFTWTAASDAESGIAKYWYAIGTSPGGTNTKDWSEVSASTHEATVTGLSLANGTTYYISVKAENGAGLKGSEGTDAIQCNVSYLVIHVDASKSDNSGSGKSWAAAKKTVQAGVDAASSGQEVWVKAGTYNECITLTSNRKMYGGFAGMETLNTQRDWLNNITILDGTGKNNAVVTAFYGDINTDTVIDGFVIQNGTGRPDGNSRLGGGIFCQCASPTISNNVIQNNSVAGQSGASHAYGGGIYTLGCSPHITNNVILDNTSTPSSATYVLGGGLFLNGGAPVVHGNSVESNTATGGGGIYLSDCPATIYNNDIVGNTTPDGGYAAGIATYQSNASILGNRIRNNISGGQTGGVVINSGSPVLANNVVSDNEAYTSPGAILCSNVTSAVIANNTIVNNKAPYNTCGGVYFWNCSPTVANNIVAYNKGGGVDKGSATPVFQHNDVYGNVSYQYSWTLIPSTDISEDPQIVNYNQDYHLLNGSPCIDAGYDSVVVSGWTDFDGNARQMNILSTGSLVDIGADEYTSSQPYDKPTKPVVTDYGQYSASTTQLQASWTSSTSQSGIVRYEYSIGKSPLGPGYGLLIDWTSNGTNTSVTKSELTLVEGGPYYFYVRAQNGFGVWSDIGISDGIPVTQQEADLDLFIGMSDFSQSIYTKKYGGDTYGDLSTTYDQVENGWQRWIDSSLMLFDENDPNEYNTYIVNMSQSGSDCKQNMQMMNITGDTNVAMLIRTQTPVNGSTSINDQMLRVGDTAYFWIDGVGKTGWNGQDVIAKLFSNLNDDYGTTVTDIIGDLGIEDNEHVIATGTSCFTTYIQLQAVRNSNVYSPSLSFSNAHLNIKRSGVIVKEWIPYSPNRDIKVQYFGWHNFSYNAGLTYNYRLAAQNYDEIVTGAAEYPYYASLRELNPDIKIYLYVTGCAIYNQGDSNECDRWNLSPWAMKNFVTNHPTWLYPDSNKGLENDPKGTDTTSYMYQYLNEGGQSDRFLVDIGTSDSFADAWAAATIEKAQHLGVDGVAIDDVGILRDLYEANGDPDIDNSDGVNRYAWQVQHFVHRVVPLLKNAGLTVIKLKCQDNCDGSASVNGDYPLRYFDPNWKPGAVEQQEGYFAQYENNTSLNTPDAMWCEYSFVKADNGWNWDWDEYWLKCLIDASIVAGWNTDLSKDEMKFIQYNSSWCSSYTDTGMTEAEAQSRWIKFTLASYLLCQNEFTNFGLSTNSYNSCPDVDFTVTKKLGLPYGEFGKLDEDNDYFLYRNYISDGSSGSYGGVVVVNGNCSSDMTFTPTDLDSQMLVYDEDGTSYGYGGDYSSISIPVHTGMIFFSSDPTQ